MMLSPEKCLCDIADNARMGMVRRCATTSNAASFLRVAKWYGCRVVGEKLKTCQLDMQAPTGKGVPTNTFNSFLLTVHMVSKKIGREKLCVSNITRVSEGLINGKFQETGNRFLTHSSLHKIDSLCNETADVPSGIEHT